MGLAGLSVWSAAGACQLDFEGMRAADTLQTLPHRNVPCAHPSTPLVHFTCTVYPNQAPATVAALLSAAWGGPPTPQGKQWVVLAVPDKVYTVRPHGQGSLVHLADQLTAYEVLVDQLQQAIKRSTAITTTGPLNCRQLGLRDSVHVTFKTCQVKWPPARRFPLGTSPGFDEVGTPLITFSLRAVRDDSLRVNLNYTFSELSLEARVTGCGGRDRFQLTVGR